MALNQSSTLEILILSDFYWRALKAVKCPSIKTIYISETKERRFWNSEFRANVEADSRLRELVRYIPLAFVFLFYST